ncbi:uncharacterized protein LOC143296629 [Babylonia areolata]|uniref:uncharacterized protein LOC143296629 n=1 Tax=Babylonia areolata TaxID=304850 RepID=UPI003FD1085C
MSPQISPSCGDAGSGDTGTSAAVISSARPSSAAVVSLQVSLLSVDVGSGGSALSTVTPPFKPTWLAEESSCGSDRLTDAAGGSVLPTDVASGVSTLAAPTARVLSQLSGTASSQPTIPVPADGSATLPATTTPGVPNWCADDLPHVQVQPDNVTSDKSVKMESMAKLEDDPQNYKTTGVAARVGDLVGLQRMVWSGRPVDVFDNRGWSPLHEAAARGFSGCLEFLLRQRGDKEWIVTRTPIRRSERPLDIGCRGLWLEGTDDDKPLSALSPFTIQKGFQCFAGALKSIKRLRNGTFLVNISLYVPSPLRCFKCQKFRHVRDRCMEEEACGTSSKAAHQGISPACCVNCRGLQLFGRSPLLGEPRASQVFPGSRHAELWLSPKTRPQQTVTDFDSSMTEPFTSTPIKSKTIDTQTSPQKDIDFDRTIEARSNDCIRLLVKKGAVINHRVYTGNTPLHLAASMGNTVVTAYLLQQGAMQNLRCHEGLTPLFMAVQRGSIDTVRILLNRLHEVDNSDDDIVNMAAVDNATPLLIAAQEGHEEIIDMLLQNGADPNIQVTDTKAGPLQYAIYCNRAKCVHKLLPVTDLLMFDNDFGVMHPLVQALGKSDTSILEELLAAGMNPIGSRLLDPEQVEELQELTDGIVEADWKASLMCHMPRDGELGAAHLLLDRGLSPNIQQDKEVPPLLAAMARRNFPLVRLLLQHGASPNVYFSTHNITMLFALHCDLQASSIADSSVQNATENSVLVKEVERYDWLEQSKGSFLIQLIIAGGEVDSLLRSPVVSGWRLRTVLQVNLAQRVFASPDAVEKRQVIAAALLGLLMCLSYGVDCLHVDFVPLVSVDHVKELNTIAEKSRTLAHMSRIFLFRQLCSRKQRLENVVASLGLPLQVGDYLLLPELESYSQTLSAVFTKHG